MRGPSPEMREFKPMMQRNWLGPVFALEWLTASRRWQGYALRCLLVLLLLLGLSGVWRGSRDGSGDWSLQQLADLGRGFYAVTTLILLGLVGLAAPAATAGAICLDKARGNLLLLFATDLSDAEVVLGKLAARLVPVLGLIACAAPVLALATLLGGVDPAMPLGSILVCTACAIFGCTLALTLSVWSRRTHEVLLATYAFGISWVLAGPAWAVMASALPGWARTAWLPGPLALLPYNPVFLVLGPLGAPPGVGPIGLGAQARFCALGLATSAVLAVAATRRIRAVVVLQAGRGKTTRGDLSHRIVRLLPSPSLDGNPVFWREWHRRRPSRWSIAVWGLFGLASAGFGLWAIVAALLGSGREMAGLFSGVHVAAGLLLLGVAAATALAEERQRGSLDVLLATPLSTRSIVLGKWRGAFRGVWPLAAVPVLVASALATHTRFAPGPVLIGGLVVAYGAAITSLGLALATWLPRTGHAIGMTAGLYTTLSIAWIPLTFSFLPGDDGIGIAAGSPPMGVGIYSAVLGGVWPRQALESQTRWTSFWIVVYGLVAAGLLTATLATFNRCLGRVDGRSPSRQEGGRRVRDSQGLVPQARSV